jgi:predicted glycosyltransferase
VKVWIDLSNSPHPLLFKPVAARLEELGHDVLVTARDNAQTVELGRQTWSGLEVIGGPAAAGKRRKAEAIAGRARDLWRWARTHRPDVALSHNSYAQIVAARLAGVRAVTAMDYEFQPANHIAFRFANRILFPEALRDVDLRRQGARAGKVAYYPGLKEELYLGDFEPAPEIASELGVELQPGELLVVARTPPTGAAYHDFETPLFESVLRHVVVNDSAHVVVLPRREEQGAEIRLLGLPRVTVPTRSVDSRSLVYAADLFLGAGGTMTREAALLGIPTLSLFAGRSPAVDRYLEREGKLRRITSVDEVGEVSPSRTERVSLEQIRARAAGLIGDFVAAAGLA